MRFAELAAFTAPLLAFVAWRVAVWRGLEGPSTRMLLAMFAVVVLGAGWVIVTSEEAAMRPGVYVPARVVDGVLVQGHTEPAR